MRDTFKPKSAEEVLPGVRVVNYRWVDTFLDWIDVNTRRVGHRPEEDRARLMELRVQQEPEGTWDKGHDWWMTSLEWNDKKFGIEVDKNDVYEANKAMSMSSQVMDTMEWRDPEYYEYYRWTAARVKATLRSGKMLPYEVIKRLKDQTRLDYVDRWIEEAGELPPLDDLIYSGLDRVRNPEYREALKEVMRGEVATMADVAAYFNQNRALDLLASILNSLEGEMRGLDRKGQNKDDGGVDWDQDSMSSQMESSANWTSFE